MAGVKFFGRFIIGSWGLLIFPGTLAVHAQDQRMEQVLTLSQSIDRSLLNNQRLLSAKEDIRLEEQRVREAQALFFPKVGLTFNSSRYLAERDSVLPPHFGSTLLPVTALANADTFYSARAWLHQSLYSGGRVRNTVRLARANLERARVRHEEIRGQVILDSHKAFYDVLLKRKQIELFEEASRKTKALARKISSRHAGRRAELGALQRRLRREMANKIRGEERAHLVYLDVMGVELYTRIGLEGTLESKPVELDLAKLLAWAQESRLEIRLTGFQQEIDQLAVNLSLSERYPVVALGAGYELNDRKFPLETTQWNATLNVSLPLFDGFSSRARVRQRRKEANKNRIERTEIKDRINREVREAHGDLIFWQGEKSLRMRELVDTQEALKAFPSKREYLNRARALEWHLHSQLAYWESVHGHLVALAKLERAVGRPLNI